MPPVHVIPLTRKDTLHSTRGLLEQCEAGAQVWLIVPWRSAWACNLVNLKVLKRDAESANLDLRLVTRHTETRLLAREAGIVTHLFVPLRLQQYRVAREAAGPLPARVVQADASLADPHRRRVDLGLGSALVALVVVAVLVAGLIASAAAFVPEMEITLHPAATRVARTIDVLADPRYTAIQVGAGIVPARSVQVIVTGRGQVPATGQVDVAGGAASGQVILANRTDSTVRVPKGTVVRTGAGTPVRFVTIADVDVPPRLNGHARVGILAQEPGPAGNVKELAISIIEGPVANSVDVLNDMPTSGGTTRPTPVVTVEDTQRLRDDLFTQLSTEAYAQLTQQLQAREFVPESSLEVLIMSQHYDQQPDSRSDVVSMELKVVARGIAIDSGTLEELASRVLAAEAGEGLAILPDSLRVSRSPGARTEENGYQMSISAEGMAAPQIDVEEVTRELRGKPVADAREWLQTNLPLAGEPVLVALPDWWDRVPWLPGRIHVSVSAQVG